MAEKDGHVTVATFEEKLWNIKGDVDKTEGKINKRIDKYADKAESIDGCVRKIELTMTEILTNQKNDRSSNERILDLLTDNIKTNVADIKENKKRINVFSGGVAVLAFIFSYLWSALSK